MLTLFVLLVLFGVLLALLALLALLLWGAVKLARARGIKVLAAVSLATVAVLALAWHVIQLRHALEVVPDGLEVASMLYSKEEYWGMGLGGGNAETGLRVFPLSGVVAKRLDDEGLRYFDAMPADGDAKYGDKWRNRYTTWRRTPVPTNVMTGKEDDQQPLTLAAVMDHACWGIEIDPDIERRADAAFRSADAFYARGRIGMLVVSPREQLVIFLYCKG